MKKDMKSKMEVLQELMDMADEMMGQKVKGDIDGMQKVTVAAKNPKDLLKGLKAAEDMAEMMPMAEKEEEMDEEESEDDLKEILRAPAYDEEESEDEEMEDEEENDEEEKSKKKTALKSLL